MRVCCLRKSNLFVSSCPYFFNRSVSIPHSGSVARDESCREPWSPCTYWRPCTSHKKDYTDYKFNPSQSSSDDTYSQNVCWKHGRSRDQRGQWKIIKTCQKQALHSVRTIMTWLITFSLYEIIFFVSRAPHEN